MIAGFQSHIKSGAASAVACFIERQNFGVLDLSIGVISAADDFALFHQYRADGGIRAGSPCALARQIQGFVHPRVCHFLRITSQTATR